MSGPYDRLAVNYYVKLLPILNQVHCRNSYLDLWYGGIIHRCIYYPLDWSTFCM